jgi:hypothetical protein
VNISSFFTTTSASNPSSNSGREPDNYVDLATESTNDSSGERERLDSEAVERAQPTVHDEDDSMASSSYSSGRGPPPRPRSLSSDPVQEAEAAKLLVQHQAAEEQAVKLQRQARQQERQERAAEAATAATAAAQAVATATEQVSTGGQSPRTTAKRATRPPTGANASPPMHNKKKPKPANPACNASPSVHTPNRK